MKDSVTKSIELLNDTKLTILICLTENSRNTQTLHCLSKTFTRLTSFDWIRSLPSEFRSNKSIICEVDINLSESIGTCRICKRIERSNNLTCSF